MSNKYEDDDDAMDLDEDDLPPKEYIDVMDKFKALKSIYNTDLFDNVIDNDYVDSDDLAQLLLDIRILTIDDRNELLDLIYALYDMEEI